MSFFVRTGNGGANSDYFIRDLGITVLTGATWTELTSYNSAGFSDGQFSPEELSRSQDLYESIQDGYLEASDDGYVIIPPAEYSPIHPLQTEVYNANGGVDLQDSRLVLPNRLTVEGLADPSARPGEVIFDVDDGYVVFFDGYVWDRFSNANGTVYAGDHDFGDANLEIPNGTALPPVGPRGNVFALDDSGHMRLYISDGSEWDQVRGGGDGDDGLWFESGGIVQLIEDGYILRVDEVQIGDSSVEIARDGYGNLTFKDQSIPDPLTLSQVIEGEIMYNKEIDETDDGETLYIGEAQPGTATSAAAWRIRRVIFTDDDGDDVSITWADGNAQFNKIWDNRLALSYA